MSSEIINRYEKINTLKNEVENLFRPLSNVRGKTQKIFDEVDGMGEPNSNDYYEQDLSEIISNCNTLNLKLNEIQKKIHILWQLEKDAYDELNQHADIESRRS